MGPVLVFLLLAQSVAPAEVRDQIVAAYGRALDALARGDADGDWVSITVGQQPRTLQELEPFKRRDIAGMKPPAGWGARWGPDYERNGVTSGIQVYDLKVDGDTAVALCLAGSAETRTIAGTPHRVWSGSHVRDTWIRTPQRWKRRKHEKLTVNERMIDGKPVENKRRQCSRGIFSVACPH